MNIVFETYYLTVFFSLWQEQLCSTCRNRK